MAIQLTSPPVVLGFGAMTNRNPAPPQATRSTMTGRTRAFQCGRSSRSMRSPSLSSRVG